MLLRSILFWLPMPFIAILNAGLREKIMGRFLGDLGSHQLSTLTLMVWMSLYAWLIYSLLKIDSPSEAWITGITWLCLTLLFEFLAGHFLFKNSWARLLTDYNLIKGRVWGIFLIYLTVLPHLIYSVKR